MSVDGKRAATVEVESGPWVEAVFELASGPRGRGGEVTIEVESDAPFTSYHYWFGSR